MTGYVAPEEDAIHAALEAQKTDKRRAAAKAAAAAQAEVCLIALLMIQ